MVLLTVLAVGLLTLSTVSLRTSAQGNDLAIARANARLGLLLALGNLQKHAGPSSKLTDSRVQAFIAASEALVARAKTGVPT